MQNIDFHLAYLLTKHECVIIPDFGAFVVSFLPASKREETGIFCSPVHSLGFNSNIKHNDGLLANSLSIEKNIPYKEATFLLKEYANYLNDQLNKSKELKIKWVGTLSLLGENRILFTPASRLSCNALHFGFSNFYLPCLKELESNREIVVEKKENREVIQISVNKRTLTWASSVAATVLALFLVSTPLNNQYEQNRQRASLLSIPVEKMEIKKEAEAATMLLDTITISEPVSISEIEQELPIVPEEKVETNTRCYYVVVSSLPTVKLAEVKLVDFLEAGFADAAIISKGDKHRIYVNKFEQKEIAESYLNEFRQNNPKYATAWLLAQRN